MHYLIIHTKTVRNSQFCTRVSHFLAYVSPLGTAYVVETQYNERRKICHRFYDWEGLARYAENDSKSRGDSLNRDDIGCQFAY